MDKADSEQGAVLWEGSTALGGEHCIPSPFSISVSLFTGFSLPAVGLRWGRREESWTLSESPAPWRIQLGLLPGGGVQTVQAAGP